VVHDHPGLRSTAWVAVQYPGGGRFDLGLLELAVVVPLAIVFLFLQRKPRHWGFYSATMCLAYAPGRFALDFLRARDVYAADPRYANLTPAQWACVGTLVFGAGLFWWSAERAGTEPLPFAASGDDTESPGENLGG
jgi:phosphatidylglycerol:prolipoprotein diacylglycerol transferase